jgi:hypothetical protein
MTLCIQVIIPFNDPPNPHPAEAEYELEDRKGGFPHSEITGSKGASASPVLIAACHVLHRLSTPRHPSEALQRLIVSQQNPCAGMKPPGGKRSPAVPAHRLYLPDYVFYRIRPESHLQAGLILSSQCQSAPPDREERNLFDREHHLVEPDGIEPTTSCLQSTRSTN